MLSSEGLRFVLRILRADRLARILKSRVGRVDLHLGEDGRKWDVLGQDIAKLLLDHVADHALGFGIEHVERVRLHSGESRRFEGEQPYLRTVAVGDDQAVLERQWSQRRRRDLDILSLKLLCERLPPFEQGITAQCCHDPHDKGPASTGSAADSSDLTRSRSGGCE